MIVIDDCPNLEPCNLIQLFTHFMSCASNLQESQTDNMSICLRN